MAFRVRNSAGTGDGGEIFTDGEGIFSIIQKELKKGYPYKVRVRKIAQMTALTAQTGQYNYLRCVKREMRQEKWRSVKLCRRPAI